MIDHEIRQMLDEARERVRRDLTARRGTLEALGALLIQQEVVDREALNRLMAAEAAAGKPLSVEAPAAG